MRDRLESLLNDFVPDDDEEDAADLGLVSNRIPSTVHLARLAIERHASEGLLRRVRSGAVRSIVIDAPSAVWLPHLTRAARKIFNGAVVIAVHEVNRYSSDGALAALSIDHPVVGISQDPDRLLPQSLISSCDFRGKVTVDGELVYQLAAACLRGRVTKRFAMLAADGLDFDELCACVATGSLAKNAFYRLERAIEAKKQGGRPANLPALSEVHGYGEAQLWGLDLQRDIADLRAGKISADAVDRGCVLVGPTGTGKSHLIRVIAQACDVPFFSVSMGNFFQKGDGHLGNVLRAMRETFEQARARRPSILFIDELDSFPHRAKLSSSNRDWWMTVVNELLVLLDGSVADRSGLVVIGAANSLDGIDDALLRKGRLERSIVVGPPDEAALAQIIRYYLREELPNTDLLPLAEAATGSTGADVEEWVRAAKRKARRADRPMVYEDLAAQVLPQDNRSAAEIYRVAIHESGHAVAITLLHGNDLERVTILRTKSSGGRAISVRRTGDFGLKRELEDTVVALLAGRAAEQAIMGDVSTAAGGDAMSDLARATNLIASWHISWGLSERISWRGTPDQTSATLTLDPKLRQAVEKDLDQLFKRALGLMEANEASLKAVACALVLQRSLTGSAVRAIMAGLSPARP